MKIMQTVGYANLGVTPNSTIQLLTSRIKFLNTLLWLISN